LSVIDKEQTLSNRIRSRDYRRSIENQSGARLQMKYDVAALFGQKLTRPLVELIDCMYRLRSLIVNVVKGGALINYQAVQKLRSDNTTGSIGYVFYLTYIVQVF
jgi:hypothetical protein